MASLAKKSATAARETCGCSRHLRNGPDYTRLGLDRKKADLALKRLEAVPGQTMARPGRRGCRRRRARLGWGNSLHAYRSRAHVR